MTATSNPGFTRLERSFIPEPANRAPAGRFGRRVFGRAAPAPADPLEVERILARCRARRVPVPAPRPRIRRRGGGSEKLAYVATGVSLLALSVVSVLPAF